MRQAKIWTEIGLTIERILKNRDSSSSPRLIVNSVKTPVHTVNSERQRHNPQLRTGQRDALTDRKYETPPAHIEGKATRDSNHDNSHDEPDQSEPPQDQANQDAHAVENLAGECSWQVRDSVNERKQVFREFPQGDYTEAYYISISVPIYSTQRMDLRESRQRQGSNRQQQADNNFALQGLM